MKKIMFGSIIFSMVDYFINFFLRTPQYLIERIKRLLQASDRLIKPKCGQLPVFVDLNWLKIEPKFCFTIKMVFNRLNKRNMEEHLKFGIGKQIPHGSTVTLRNENKNIEILNFS